MLCDACGYSANRQIAKFKKYIPAKETPLEVEKVSTPNSKTIEELASFLNIPKSKTAKAVFLVATISPEGDAQNSNRIELESGMNQCFVFAIVRGDMEVNETKLANAIKARELRPATEDEIRSVGAVPGYASPVGLKKESNRPEVLVVVDDSIPDSANLVAGANQEGYHLQNVNYGRDYQADIITDIANAQAGDACPDCGKPMRAERGVEIGNIFKLGTRYTDVMGCYFLDQDGQSRPVIMGSYGIGSGRLLACIAEEHHDEQGLIWPITVAPYSVHLITLAGRDKENDISLMAEGLYKNLSAVGIEVLFDDRNESPGVKFNDADLIGLPIRLTVSQRALKNGGVEYKRRDQTERSIIPLEKVVAFIKQEIAALEARIASMVIEVPFDS